MVQVIEIVTFEHGIDEIGLWDKVFRKPLRVKLEDGCPQMLASVTIIVMRAIALKAQASGCIQVAKVNFDFIAS
jgi:hypothetical protein